MASPGSKSRAAADLFVPIHLLAPLVHFLRLEAQRRDRPCIETRDPDGVARLFAIAVSAILDPLQRGVDLADQLALPVARPELQRPVAASRP